MAPGGYCSLQVKRLPINQTCKLQDYKITINQLVSYKTTDYNLPNCKNTKLQGLHGCKLGSLILLRLNSLVAPRGPADLREFACELTSSWPLARVDVWL